MTDVANLLEDPFLIHHLNPNFLEALKGYWKTLSQAEVSDEGKEQIREAFYNLVRFAFRHLFRPLYLKYPPKMKGSVFVMSAVHSDGIGDYIATLKCSQLLKEHHPEIDVHVAYTHQQKLPLVDPVFHLLEKENIHPFQETEDLSSKILGNVLEGKTEFSFLRELEKLQNEKQKIQAEYETLQENHPLAASAIKELADEMDKSIQHYQHLLKKKVDAEHLYDKMKESLAIVHVALALNTFDNPELAPKSLYFAESGNFQGIGNYLQRHWYSMGLDAFEEGIFLRKQKEVQEWIDIKLSRYLWTVDQPNQSQIQDYLKQHSLHVGYLPRIPEQKHIFIKLVCSRSIQDKRHIDIILPKHDREVLLHFTKEWMLASGISKIVAVDYSQGMKEHVLEQIELPSEKVLRLIYALPLSSSDFIKLINLSGDIVGCTGDGSLSDCMIAGKIPFYEVRKHKLSTLNAFKKLARVLTLPDVMEYFEQLELFFVWPAESFVEKFERILQEGSFKMQWNVLMEFIRHYYCFEDAFLSHINRHLYTSASSDFKEKEEILIQDFFARIITAENAYQTLETMLRNRSGKQI